MHLGMRLSWTAFRTVTDLLPDVQGAPDSRGIAIDEVGVTGLRYPLTFSDGVIEQSGIAEFEITVGLPADHLGTHMSRMVQAVEAHLRTANPYELHTALKGDCPQFG